MAQVAGGEAREGGREGDSDGAVGHVEAVEGAARNGAAVLAPRGVDDEERRGLREGALEGEGAVGDEGGACVARAAAGAAEALQALEVVGWGWILG